MTGFATPRGLVTRTNRMPMSRRSLSMAFCLVVLSVSTGIAQIGGRTTYNFLNLTPSARITALGGSLITVSDDDIANGVMNPALLNESMSGSMTFQNNFHFDGIYNGYVAYGHHIEDWGITAHGGIQFMQYGQFVRADEFGNQLGDFKASEMAITIGASRWFAENFSAGMNLRFINSNLESFNSFGISADIGALYDNKEARFSAALTIRNVGVQVTPYEETREDVPLDIQLGISKRLQHLPFRFTVIAHTLNRWNLRYDSPLADDEPALIGEENNEQSAFGQGVDNFFRHFIFGGEFLIGKTEVLKLRVGYNHQRRKELSISSLRSLAGFSAGVGIRIKMFSIDYGFGAYHIAGSTQHVGISTNLSRFKKQESTIID